MRIFLRRALLVSTTISKSRTTKALLLGLGVARPWLPSASSLPCVSAKLGKTSALTQNKLSAHLSSRPTVLPRVLSRSSPFGHLSSPSLATAFPNRFSSSPENFPHRLSPPVHQKPPPPSRLPRREGLRNLPQHPPNLFPHSTNFLLMHPQSQPQTSPRSPHLLRQSHLLFRLDYKRALKIMRPAIGSFKYMPNTHQAQSTAVFCPIGTTSWPFSPIADLICLSPR